DSFDLGHGRLQAPEMRRGPAHVPNVGGERVVEPFHELEQAGVDMAPLLAERVRPAMCGERVVEVDQELGQAVGAEVVRALEGRIHLVGVVEAAGGRVVDRVDLGDEVGHIELELDQLEVRVEIARAEAELVAEVGEDVCDLADAQVTVDDVGRGERTDALARVQVLDERVRALLAGHVLVLDLAGFHEQADELAAAGDVRPVPELDAHEASPGAKARIASAWTRSPGMSPNARLTMRWRSSRLLPAKATLSITTVKCDSPLPSSPMWPRWRALSLITSSRVGRNASCSRISISRATGPLICRFRGFSCAPPIT